MEGRKIHEQGDKYCMKRRYYRFEASRIWSSNSGLKGRNIHSMTLIEQFGVRVG